MHVCTDLTSFYTLIRKSFGEMGSEPLLPPREKSPLRGGSNPRSCTTQDSEPYTLPTELFRCNKPKSLYATNTTIVILATLKVRSVVFIAQAFTPKTLFLATPVTLSSSKNYYSSTMYAKITIPINDHAK